MKFTLKGIYTELFYTTLRWKQKLGFEEGLYHSHKKWNDSWKHGHRNLETSMLCWNLPSSSKHWRSLFKKTWLSLKGITYLHVIFVLIWMKQTWTWFNLQRDETRNGFSNINNTFEESLQLQMSILH